ncbi:hypothetical protein GIB67_031200 [Kingdonia uniflora]|uniref:Uncharacterized protein n=1 Tax=Kingdonia uniflora TaxID=39325 RepID=A0A7J7NKA5_9MAGN|nr:hypothetical protein GIB67_031200 [Kingdonia uniflora]
MVLQKPKPNAHFSIITNGGGLRSKRGIINGGGSLRMRRAKPIDHWVFLEEIDAPMWVDLVLESNSMFQDTEDKWFEITHPFHQCSTHELISSLSVEKKKSDVDLFGPVSSNLPPSVSRTRGKHYRSRTWKRGDKVVSANKQHPIKFFVGKSNEAKTKFRNLKHLSSLKEKLVGKRSLTDDIKQKFRRENPISESMKRTLRTKVSLFEEKNSTDAFRSNFSRSKPTSNSSYNTRFTVPSSSGCTYKPKSDNLAGKNVHAIRNKYLHTKHSFEDSKSTLISKASSGIANSSSSGDLSKSLTSKAGIVIQSSQQQRQRVFEVSHQICSQKTGLSSSVRINFKRSSVTTQPSRLKVNDRRISEYHNSSTSKSSLGSLTNSGYYLDSTVHKSKLNKSETPETVEPTEMAQTIYHNKVKTKKGTRRSSAQVLDRHSTSKRKVKIVATRSVCQKTAIAKTDSRRPLHLHKAQNIIKVELRAQKCVDNVGKINALGCTISSQKAKGKENTFGSTIWGAEASKCSSEVKDDKESFDPKV